LELDTVSESSCSIYIWDISTMSVTSFSKCFGAQESPRVARTASVVRKSFITRSGCISVMCVCQRTGWDWSIPPSDSQINYAVHVFAL